VVLQDVAPHPRIALPEFAPEQLSSLRGALVDLQAVESIFDPLEILIQGKALHAPLENRRVFQKCPTIPINLHRIAGLIKGQ
jgi:hypothetical protein